MSPQITEALKKTAGAWDFEIKQRKKGQRRENTF